MPVRMQIGLHRLALDLLANRVLLAIGVRHIVMSESEQAAAHQQRRRQHRHGQPVQADAAGFHGRDLVVLGENAESDQHRHQHADGRRVEDQLRRQKEQISEHARHRDVVLHDVAQQIEERVDVRHQHEADQQQPEPEQEAFQNVAVHHLGDQEHSPAAAARAQLRGGQRAAFHAGRPRRRRSNRSPRRSSRDRPGRSSASAETNPPRRRSRWGSTSRLPPEALCCLAKPCGGDQSHPIDERQRHGEHEGRRFSALARRNARAESRSAPAGNRPAAAPAAGAVRCAPESRCRDRAFCRDRPADKAEWCRFRCSLWRARRWAWWPPEPVRTWSGTTSCSIRSDPCLRHKWSSCWRESWI